MRSKSKRTVFMEKGLPEKWQGFAQEWQGFAGYHVET
jgi:hypothetical protein